MSVRQERRRRATLPGVGTPRALTLRSTSADEASGALPVRTADELGPLVSEITSDTRSLIRARDGAKGWRCTLSHISGGPRLPYWILPSGVIEFEAVGYHDKLSSSIR